MKRLLLIILFPFLVFATKYGQVKIWDGKNVLGVNGDSSITVRPQDFGLNVAMDSMPGITYIHKYGDNPDIDLGSGFEDLWDFGGKYNFLSTGEIHNIASTDPEDSGYVVTSGTVTACDINTNTMCDSSATFTTDTVITGDFIVNYTKSTLSFVFSVVNDTQLIHADILIPGTGKTGLVHEPGDEYAIVRAGGAGAALIYFYGLTFFGSQQLTEIVVLSGTTPVPTDSAYWRIYRMGVISSGDSAKAIGVITATASVSATVTAQIFDGNNQSLMAVYTIPGDKHGYLTKWWGSISNKTSAISTVILRAGTGTGTTFILQKRTISTSGSSSFEFKYDPPLFFPSFIDIFIEADVSTPNVGVSGGFDLLLIEK